MLPAGGGKDAARTPLSPTCLRRRQLGAGSRGGDRWGRAGREAFVCAVAAARGDTDPQMAAADGARAAARGQAKRWAQGIRPFCWGLTSGSGGPFPAAPHQPFNFQLDLLLSHGNGMQMGLGLGGGGAARGQRLRPASGSLHPNLRDHTHSLGAAGGPWGEGVPLVPQQWSSSLPLPRKTIPAARS